jgi:hypothetical protein
MQHLILNVRVNKTGDPLTNDCSAREHTLSLGVCLGEIFPALRDIHVNPHTRRG